MTAYPEKLSVEKMFSQEPVVPPSVDAERPPANSAPIEGPWRVVSADGTTSICHQPAAEDCDCDTACPADSPAGDPQAEAAEIAQQLWPVGEEPWRQLDEVAETVAAYTEAFSKIAPQALEAAATLPSIESGISMPHASPDLSGALGLNQRAPRAQVLRTGRRDPSRKLGAAAVVSKDAAKQGQAGQVLELLDSQVAKPQPLPTPPPSNRREVDAHLARVIEIWPKLPRNIQAAILAMVEVTRDSQG